MTWQPLAEPLSRVEVERMEESSVHVLRGVTALEERMPEVKDESTQEFLEQSGLVDKINLAIEMLGHLLTLHNPLPPAVPVRLSGQAIEWDVASAAPSPGSRGVVCLHIHRYVPQPLRLAGTVRDTELLPDGTTQVWVEFDPMGEPLANALQRHVFRRHRRAIAGARRA